MKKCFILLRFHKDPELVQNRIELLKYFNPGVEIHGLFGGPENQVAEYSQVRGLSSLTVTQRAIVKDPWLFSDVAVLDWYRQTGQQLEFDVLHIVEYDLLLLQPLAEIYPYADGERHIYINTLTDLEKVKGSWFWFTKPETFPTEESKALVAYMEKEHHIFTHYASQGPGTTVTKEFFEGYSKLHFPQIAHDELRVPAIAQLLKIPMKSINFTGDWFDSKSETFQLFNCEKRAVTKAQVLDALHRGVRTTFHPVYEKIDIKEFSR